MNNITKKGITTQDNTKIRFNHYENNKKDVVIISPGWCMTKDSKSFLKISEIFINNFDVITIDYRGHGESGGFFTFGAKEILDLEAVINYAKENYNYEKINLVGFSLGASTSLIAASNLNFINAIIAVSPPSNFAKIENHMWKKAAWYETIKKFELNRFLSIRPSIIPHKKIKTIDIIKKIKSKTLFIAGGKDPTVYPWHTEELYKNATCKKEYKLFKDGYHAEDLYLYYPEEFKTLCSHWLNRNS